MKKTKPLSKLQTREMKLLVELQSKHGYTLFDMRKERDRIESLMNFTSGKCTTIRMIRLGVPMKSALGVAMQSSAKKSADLAKKRIAAMKPGRLKRAALARTQ